MGKNRVSGGENAPRKTVTLLEFQVFSMKRFVFLLLICFFVFSSCGTLKTTQSKEANENSYILPPNVNSNKYSKKRN
jgi:hypothetical protein